MTCSGFVVNSRNFPTVSHIPVVGDILDVGLLREVFSAHRPHSVFHAAAYKHVPMMEMNCFQAVTNNIFGTYNVALVARQFEVEDFVMISTDKAVKPTNIMGEPSQSPNSSSLGFSINARALWQFVSAMCSAVTEVYAHI